MIRRIVLLLLLFQAVTVFAANPIKNLINRSGDTFKYPHDDLLVIFDSTNVIVDKSGLSYVYGHKLIKVLTAKGAKSLNAIIYDYDPGSAFVRFDNVTIYRKNGKIEKLDVSKVFDYPAPARMIYWGARQIMIGVGRLEIGDAVEIMMFKKGFTYALLQSNEEEKYIPPMRGHFYDIVPFWSSHSVITKFYGVTVPETKTVQYKFYNGNPIVRKTKREGNNIYSFTLKNISKIKRAAHSVAMSDIGPKLLISTSPDWEAKSKWFYGVNEEYGSFKSTKSINKKVKELLVDAENENDSISILTHWVADNMRYSGISMGKGEGYTLHSGDMNFTDRCGVCKDKAGLLITMLRAAGFEAYAAMTMAGSRIEDLPADQFNHSVTVVKLSDGKFHLLDPTWVPFVRELWSSLEQQQNYLMGLPNGADLMETQISKPENHFLKILGESTIAKDGTIKGSITIKAEGQSDAAIRRNFVSSFKTKWKSRMDNELLKISSDIIFEYTGLENPYDYSMPFNISINYEIPNYALVTTEEMIFKSVVTNNFLKKFMSHLYFDTNLKTRDYPFKDRCSRLVEISDKIKLPLGYKVKKLLDAKEIDGNAASYKSAINQEGDLLTITATIKLEKRIYDSSEWDEFKSVVIEQNELAKYRIILVNN